MGQPLTLPFYCTKVHKTGLAGQRVEKFGQCLTKYYQISQGTHTNLVYSHTGYYVISYCRSTFIEVGKTPEMSLPADLGGILVAQHFACPTSWWIYCYMALAAMSLLFVLKTLQFLNYCRSCINRVKQQKLAVGYQ